MKKTFHRLNRKVGIKALNRARWMCELCGSFGDLCVHHKKRMSPSDKQYNNIDNLLVVCRSCHMSLHRKAGHIMSYSDGKGNYFGRRGKGNPPVKCKIDGCERMQHGRALCKKHYEYYRRRNWVQV